MAFGEAAHRPRANPGRTDELLTGREKLATDGGKVNATPALAAAVAHHRSDVDPAPRCADDGGALLGSSRPPYADASAVKTAWAGQSARRRPATAGRSGPAWQDQRAFGVAPFKLPAPAGARGESGRPSVLLA